jgi:hypothetical protein
MILGEGDFVFVRVWCLCVGVRVGLLLPGPLVRAPGRPFEESLLECVSVCVVGNESVWV